MQNKPVHLTPKARVFRKNDGSGKVLGRLTVRHAVGGLEQDAERSECPVVMVGISLHVRDFVRRLTFSGSLVMGTMSESDENRESK